MLRHSRCGFPREFATCFSIALPKERIFAPKVRERSAVKGATVSSVLLRQSTCRPCEASSPYGAPLRCLDGGTPLPRRPAMVITPWPSDDDATEDSIRGSLVSREAFSTRLPGHGLRDHARGHRTLSTLRSLCRAPLSEQGYVRHTDGIRQRQDKNLIRAMAC